MQRQLFEMGYHRLASGDTTLKGMPATTLTYARGDRDVYKFAIGYGPEKIAHYYRYVNNSASGTLTASYRVATIGVVHSILPRRCTANEADCLALVPEPNSAVGA